MIIEDRRIQFGKLFKDFRKHYLEMSKSVLGRMTQMPREQIMKLERGDKCFIDINALCFLLDMGFPIDRLKNYSIQRDVEDYLILERFKKKIMSKKLRFDFDMFCELNKEHIEENYIEGVLEQFNGSTRG